MTVFRWLNNNMGCIEIPEAKKLEYEKAMLNNNMGCIEIYPIYGRKATK